MADLKVNEKGIIKSFSDETLSVKLIEMGCLPGSEIRLNFMAPFNGPIAIKVAGYHLSLRLEEAKSIKTGRLVQMPNTQKLKIALVGNPNSGKTTLFNLLTGLSQKTGNFPGVTVDKKSGVVKLPDGRVAEVTDLPGTYSIYPKTLDEQIVQEVLLDRDHSQHPDNSSCCY